MPAQIDTSDVAGATPYVAQQYTGGDSCELTGRPREAEVRFTCGTSSDTLLVSVQEPSSCTYTLTIATPRLCKHPAFQQQPPPAALIQCHALPEEGGGVEAGAGSCAVADSGAEHGSCATDASVPAAADVGGGAASPAAGTAQPAAAPEEAAEAADEEEEYADAEEEAEDEDEYADGEEEPAGAEADDDDPYL